MGKNTEMTSSKIRVESCDSTQKVLRIVPTDSFDIQSDSALLHQTVESLIKANKVHLIIDLSHVPYPNTSLIAYLIELTSLLRRSGGDLLLANITESARMNFMTFSPFSYLRVSEETEMKETDSEGLGFVFDSELLEEQEAKNKPVPFQIKDYQAKSAETISVDEILDVPDNSTKPAVTFRPHSDEVEFEDLVGDAAMDFREPENEQIVVHSREDQLYKLTDFVTVMAERAGFSESEVSRIKISVYEAAVNIIEHAYKYDPHNHIDVVVKYDNIQFKITMMDRGKGFEYDPNKDYDAVEAAEEKRSGGFGLHIIKRSMDEVTYDSDPQWGNRLTLVKNVE